jgi:hypothetical protein
MLQVEAENTPALRLYKKCGFIAASHPGCQVAVLRRRLHGAQVPVVGAATALRAEGERERLQAGQQPQSGSGRGTS